MMLYGAQDRLVLYIEEEYEGQRDTSCYILYDFVEKEYFICGSRLDEAKQEYARFHFYCASRETLLDYMSFITNARDSVLTYGLYNYPNIFGNNEMVNLDTLETQKNDENEIAVYLKMEFNRKQFRRTLRMLKDVRY